MAFTSPDGRTQTALADINITPLVDVVLVLLIIFMVTAPVLQSGIEVSVPKTRTVKELTEERVVIRTGPSAVKSASSSATCWLLSGSASSISSPRRKCAIASRLAERLAARSPAFFQ